VVIRSWYARVVMWLVGALSCLFVVIALEALTDQVPWPGWAVVGGLWLAVLVRSFRVKVVLSDSEIEVVNFFRRVSVDRGSVAGVASGYLPFTAEPVLMLIVGDRRVRMMATVSSTPRGRQKVLDWLGSEMGGSAAAVATFADDAVLRWVLVHPWGTSLVAIGLGVGIGLLAQLSGFETLVGGLMAGAVVRVGAWGLGRQMQDR
jgi:hypothetical protein